MLTTKVTSNDANSHLENIQFAAEFFKLRQWSQDTMRINAHGKLEMCLDEAHHIELLKLVEDLQQQGHRPPFLLRFPTLITQQTQRIQHAFLQAIQQTNYQNQYTLAYAIKANPHHGVLHTLVQLSGTKQLSFVAGSKAEFLLLLMQADKQHLIFAHGFKDLTYIKLALAAAANGQHICLVLETLDEINLLVNLAQQTQITMQIGLRIRLNNTASGIWQDSNGQYAKFGLSSSELIAAVHLLKQHQLLHLVNTLHIHSGSQILNLNDIITCFHECVRHYHELYKLGIQVTYLNIGGGLAIDYSGSGHDQFNSYSVEDYAMAIVEQLASYCQQHQLPYPHLVSEPGRAVVANSALVITDVLPLKQKTPLTLAPLQHDSPQLLQELWQFYQDIPNYQDKFHLQQAESHLAQLLNTIRHEFTLGALDLSHMGLAEQLYDLSQDSLTKQLNIITHYHANNKYQQNKYLVNFSLFQSMPDHWGIKQFFPLLPLHGYRQPLTQNGVFYDLTCDSDGVIRQYLHPQKLQHTLRLPQDTPIDYIAIFLIGAYQEVLASRHNLFERPLCIDVLLDEQQRKITTKVYEFCDIQQSLAALGYLQDELLENIKHKFDNTLQDLIIQQLACTSYLQQETT